MGAWQPVTVPTAGSVSSATAFGIPVAENMSDSLWVTPGSFTNSWTNGGGVAYRLIGNRVMLRGTLGGPGTANLAAFTLPAGYRPAQQVTFANGGGAGVGADDITSAGAVIPTVSQVHNVDACQFTVD